MYKKLSILPVLLLASKLFSQNFISDKKEAGSLLLCSSSQPAIICVDSNDDWLVLKAASLLQTDVEQVTGSKPELDNDIKRTKGRNVIVIGSVEKSSLIKQLAQEEKIS